MTNLDFQCVTTFGTGNPVRITFPVIDILKD
jgi:hypothetical protein